MREQLPCERKHGGVNEMKQGHTHREDQQLSMRQQGPDAFLGAVRPGALGNGRARDIMVDIFFIDKQNSHHTDPCDCRHQIENPFASKEVACQSGQGGRADIPGVIECLGTAHLSGEFLRPHDTEGKGGHGGRENSGGDADEHSLLFERIDQPSARPED